MKKHLKKLSHSGTKENRLLVIQIQKAIWRKLNNLKPSSLAAIELYISRLSLIVQVNSSPE